MTTFPARDDEPTPLDDMYQEWGIDPDGPESPGRSVGRG